MKRKKAEEGPTEDGGRVGSRISRRRNSKPALMQNKPAAWACRASRGRGITQREEPVRGRGREPADESRAEPG